MAVRKRTMTIEQNTDNLLSCVDELRSNHVIEAEEPNSPFTHSSSASQTDLSIMFTIMSMSIVLLAIVVQTVARARFSSLC